MVYSKMSLGNAILVALLYALHVTRMTSAVGSHAEQAVYNLANVARTHMSRFDMAVRSSSPEWFLDGMQLFAYDRTNKRWDKRTLAWAITKYPSKIPRESVDEVMRAAFAKWAAVIPFVFVKITPNPELILFTQQPDIRILFEPMSLDSLSCASLPTQGDLMDVAGADIFINDSTNWTDEQGVDWHNLRFTALYQIGYVLGLAGSTERSAIMYDGINPSATARDDPALDEDDILGVQSMYGGPRKVLSGPP